MKTRHGALALALLKMSRTRDAPTPTNVSMNSEPESEKNGTPGTATATSSAYAHYLVMTRVRRVLVDARVEAAHELQVHVRREVLRPRMEKVWVKSLASSSRSAGSRARGPWLWAPPQVAAPFAAPASGTADGRHGSMGGRRSGSPRRGKRTMRGWGEEDDEDEGLGLPRSSSVSATAVEAGPAARRRRAYVRGQSTLRSCT
jgi:hypothetical protein